MESLAGHYQYVVPVFVVVILVEMIYSARQQLKLYSARDTAVNVQLMLMFFGLDLICKVLWYSVLGWFFEHRISGPIANPWLYWPIAIIFQDFCYYIHHYLDHHVRLFWAVHVPHHSSEEFNISTGFRSPVLQPLFRYTFYIPMALFGFGPFDILLCYALTQHWGTFAHTQTIKKLPHIIEFIFVTPSHHRVHHAVNPRYLDKNMGMFLILWDRLFGTFTQESDLEPVRFGLTTPIEKPGDAFYVIGHEWKQLWHDLMHAPNWESQWMYLFGPPGWSHDGSRRTSAEIRRAHGLSGSAPQ